VNDDDQSKPTHDEADEVLELVDEVTDAMSHHSVKVQAAALYALMTGDQELNAAINALSTTALVEAFKRLQDEPVANETSYRRSEWKA
jgi:hypothetical protein